MYIYVVVDDEDRSLFGVYDEQTFKEKYKEYIINPPLYSNQDYWDKCSVLKIKINSEDYESVFPEDIK